VNERKRKEAFAKARSQKI